MCGGCFPELSTVVAFDLGDGWRIVMSHTHSDESYI